MVDKVTKKLTLNLSKVPERSQKRVKKEISDFVINEILRSVEKGQSPVEGEGAFDKLNPLYAKKEKGGNRTANLELEGDLLDALVSKNTPDGIEVGIFKKSEVGKADGHNKFSRANNSRLPQRRFIPKPSQRFKKDLGIEKEIRLIIKENETKDESVKQVGIKRQGTFTDVSTATTTAVEATDLFDDFLEDFLNGQN